MSDINETTNAATTAPVATPVVLTKEEKIAKIDKEIARLTLKRYNIENDIVEAPKAKKEVVLPEVGATVLFTTGRRTATTEPVQKIGTVFAVKPKQVVGDKTTPAQIKILSGEGADAEFFTVYPNQIVPATDAPAEAAAE